MDPKFFKIDCCFDVHVEATFIAEETLGQGEPADSNNAVVVAESNVRYINQAVVFATRGRMESLGFRPEDGRKETTRRLWRRRQRCHGGVGGEKEARRDELEGMKETDPNKKKPSCPLVGDEPGAIARIQTTCNRLPLAESTSPLRKHWRIKQHTTPHDHLLRCPSTEPEPKVTSSRLRNERARLFWIS